MEWQKKASFQDYLNQHLGIAGESPYYSSDVQPSFVFNIESLPSIKAYKNPYPVQRLSLEERVERFLSQWSADQRQKWEIIKSIALKYGNQEAFPWMWKETFKKLALKVHPDHNSRPGANRDFQRLYQAYRDLKKLNAYACT